MKIKIVSDGTVKGTYITDALGGRLEGVLNILWTLDVESGQATVMLQLVDVPVQLEGELKKLNAPSVPSPEEGKE